MGKSLTDTGRKGRELRSQSSIHAACVPSRVFNETLMSREIDKNLLRVRVLSTAKAAVLQSEVATVVEKVQSARTPI